MENVLRDQALLWKVFIDLLPTQHPHQLNGLIFKNESDTVCTHPDPVSTFKAGQFFTG